MKKTIVIVVVALGVAMLAMFGRPFRRRTKVPNDEPTSFRAAVLEVVRVQYPGHRFSAPRDDPDVVVVKDTRLGLQNLRAKFELSDRKQSTLETLVKQHFDVVLTHAVHLDRLHRLPPFDGARARLLPQIMPAEYAEQSPVVTFPFGGDLLVGLVLDDERGYLYLKTEDIDQWGRTPDELYEIAVDNLNSASENVQLHSSQPEQARYIVIKTNDGFDAARILVPKLRGFVAERLGRPFYFGVPNRDVLICWSADSSDKFREFVRGMLRKDNAAQPYPLSPHVYCVTVNDEIKRSEETTEGNAANGAP